MTTQTMTALNSITALESDLDSIVRQAIDKAVGELTNRIWELEQKVEEQEQRLVALEPKREARQTSPKVKEITLKELKAQAAELGVTDRDVKDQGSKTKKASWQQAIQLKLVHNAEDVQELGVEESKVDMFDASNPYSIEGLEMLYVLNSATPAITGLVVNPF